MVFLVVGRCQPGAWPRAAGKRIKHPHSTVTLAAVVALLPVSVTAAQFVAPVPRMAQRAIEKSNMPEERERRECASSSDAVKELGLVKGTAIPTGFVFVDGQYVAPPYFVSRRGIRIFINGEVVFKWRLWPLPDLHVDKDPDLPEGLTEASTLDDLRDRDNPLNSHLARKLRYLFQHFDPEVAMQKMAEYYQQLPFVQSVVRERPDRPAKLVLTMRNGAQVRVRISPPPPGSPYHWDFSSKDVLGRLDWMRQRYETRLMKGDCFFLFSSGEELSWGRRQTARDLGLMVEILRSDRPKKDKVSLLQRMEVLPPPSRGDIDKFTALVTGFQAPPELDEHIRKVVAETGITPRRLKDIPHEIPFERILRLEKEAKERANQPQK